MRILLVSQFHPGPAAPHYGVFVRDLAQALEERGHELARAVVDRQGAGRRGDLGLARDALRRSRSFRPDVVWSHFLVPAGLAAALTTRAPLVATAHGQDVANVGRIPGVRAATRLVARRAASLVAVSDWLRRELEAKVPEARGKTEVANCGVALDRFPLLGRTGGEAPSFLCVGSLIERKNPLRLARAFERLGEGTLTFVGDGPLRPQLEGRPGVRVVGAVPPEEVPRHVAASDVVCQPSLVEPFGQAVLEAMAAGRTVVATRVGGPPEFVPLEAGILVDAAGRPVPNEAARAAAERHSVSAQARRVEEILLRAAGRDRPV